MSIKNEVAMKSKLTTLPPASAAAAVPLRGWFLTVMTLIIVITVQQRYYLLNVTDCPCFFFVDKTKKRHYGQNVLGSNTKKFSGVFFVINFPFREWFYK